MANSDPHYNRKPVPDEFLEHVGVTGLTKQEEYINREKKLSTEHGDLRKFFNPKSSKGGSLDPHYARKPVPDSMIQGVGVTGLTPQEEFNNRERKMSVNGVDIRKFSTSATSGMEPQNDPYYGRKPVDKTEIHGVGESGLSAAEAYENRENKASLFDLSSDPFQLISGTGHRQSVSAAASAGAADARRRSSANAGSDAARAVANVHGPGAHSGYTGESRLPPIDSGENTFNQTAGRASDNQYNYGNTTGTTTTTTTTTTSSSGGLNQHGLYHDIATQDPDSVAPDERR